MASVPEQRHNQVVGTLSSINSTLLGIKTQNERLRQTIIDRSNAEVKAEEKGEKQTLRERATAFMKSSGKDDKPDIKPKDQKAGAKQSGSGGGEASLPMFAKIMGLATLGLLFKDQIIGFFTGLLGQFSGFINDWWENTFKPAAEKLYIALVPEPLRNAITSISNWFGEQWAALQNSSFWKFLFGNEETGEEGALSGPIKSVKEWFGNATEALGQFGKDIGLFNEDGSFSLGGALAGGAGIATITTLFGAKGLFSLLTAPLKIITKGIGGLAKFGWKGLTAALSGLMSFLPKGAGAAGSKAVAGASAATGAAAAKDLGRENAQRGRNLTDKQKVNLEKQGLKVSKDGAITDSKGRMVSADKASAALDKTGAKGGGGAPKVTAGAGAAPTASKGGGGAGRKPPTGGKPAVDLNKSVSKFPKLAQAAKIAGKVPLVGTAISAFMAGNILLDDSIPVKDKVAKLAGLLGGIGGGTLGAFVGALAGSVFPGPGNLIGGIGGGVLGGLLGDTMAEGLAQWMLGEKVTAFPKFEDSWWNPLGGMDMNSIFNGGDSKPKGAEGGGASGESIPSMSKGQAEETLKSGGGTDIPETGAAGSNADVPSITAGQSSVKDAKIASVSNEGVASGVAAKQQGASSPPVVINNNNQSGGEASPPPPAPPIVIAPPPSQIPKDVGRKYAYGVA